MLLWGSQLMTQESQWLASWVMLATVHCSAEKFPNPTDFTCFMTILFFWLLNGFDIVLKFNWNDFFLYRNISKWAFKQKNDTRSHFPMGWIWKKWNTQSKVIKTNTRRTKTNTAAVFKCLFAYQQPRAQHNVIKAFSHSASSLPHWFPAKHAVFLYFSFIFIVHHPVCVLSAIDVIASKPVSALLVWLHGSSRFLLIHQK